jgi:hypothetical protein
MLVPPFAEKSLDVALVMECVSLFLYAMQLRTVRMSLFSSHLKNARAFVRWKSAANLICRTKGSNSVATEQA